MKILLVGEFSGFHLNLKKGLEKLGHNVTLLSSGDGWKKIPTDKKIFSLGVKNPFLKLYYMCMDYINVSSLKGFDVVQFIQPVIFPNYFRYNELLIGKLVKNNKKSFLIAAGSDSYYWKNYKTKFKYSPHEDMKNIDNNGKKYLYETHHVISFNERLASKVNGIIPIMYDYKIGYKEFVNLKEVIPLPIDLSEIEYVENTVKDKVVIFHGLNREGFKGTRHIKEALKRLEEDFPNEVEIIVKGHMAYDEYKKLLYKTNIVIDQANSYSYGVNAAISLAMGKIVLSGCEPETLESFNIKSSPIINILPDSNDIYLKLKYLICSKCDFNTAGQLSRKYVEELHDAIKVAIKFEEVYRGG